jgi:hypothetical protein
MKLATEIINTTTSLDVLLEKAGVTPCRANGWVLVTSRSW